MDTDLTNRVEQLEGELIASSLLVSRLVKLVDRREVKSIVRDIKKIRDKEQPVGLSRFRRKGFVSFLDRLLENLLN